MMKKYLVVQWVKTSFNNITVSIIQDVLEKRGEKGWKRTIRTKNTVDI